MKKLTLLLPLLLVGCATRTPNDTLITMQIIDRNGFSETIGTKDRLSPYKKVDYNTPQPYQKVLRVFAKNDEGKSRSALTTYHPNGQIWQSLDIIDGRAHGSFREWHQNGRLRLDLTVIDGTADTTGLAQKSWLFDGIASVYDERGRLIAEISYDKGILERPSLYYHDNGALQKRIPYVRGEIDGTIEVYDQEGNLIETILYQNGLLHGSAIGLWNQEQKKYVETYEKGLLQTARYFDASGQKIARIDDGNGFQAHFDPREGTLFDLCEVRSGKQEGIVKHFSPQGALTRTYHVLNGMKHGEEIAYYPAKEGDPKPKLLLTWHEDTLQGPVKTWFPDGTQESTKELYQNIKQGYSFAWYKDGSLMLSEEYNNNNLVKGSYFAKGNKRPVSQITNGRGTATLFDENGNMSQKVEYDNGKPLLVKD